ncbi:sine oculis-binding protein homolog isoform X1 [Seriola aureovittata]|uniref:sine oculis-binding protein homolog isoform X1 n=1 Tax=Seriola aureovittata TaxID=2871759 RepID=UPI0024BDEB79|nr:sine oculis-binding protein homolog isoform X1 [Seriola aureovittata]XP_056261364.1 sine oculis-binding protein homolog isoform X1 [Seriola aureovittata]XP_056261365.1 sine oculis-binding protein homolog isoform X1 [Seriola aureovittata]
MPEMEKGRPPENKRSRKPAHPVKREINQEMKTFAESTMNELLGWYGYDKVDLRESEANEIRNYRERRQHVSVLKENSLPKPKSLDTKVSHSVLAMKCGERDSSSVPSSSPSSSSTSSSLTTPKEHKSAPVIVPLIKPSAVEDVQNVQIVCVWCQKEGVKRYSLCMGSELKSFCSEKCFAACRRAYFKRNKARDEDLHGERSPQHPHTEDSPRLVLKINSNVRSLSPVPQVCDWCKHVRHTKEYLDFGSGEERLQFCSTKCLNQYKMDVFYREARAALTSTSSSPSRTSQEGRAESCVAGQKLLTPESWNSSNSIGEARHRNLSPKGPALIHGSAESTSISSSEASSSSSSKVPVSGLRTLERPIQPPPHPPAVEVSPHPAPLPPPPPPRPPLEHQPLPQIPIPFIRPPLHAQGMKSPLANPPRHPGPPSSPIHRPPHSPHLQPPTSSSMNPPGLMHPFPGAYFPGLHSPPLNMMPRGPVPMPPIMNFGIPSFSPLLPQPTVLVPYPIIVPLPVPIPIPIPIPVPSKATLETPSHSGVIQPVPEGVDRGRSRVTRLPSPGIPEGDSRLVANKLGGTLTQGLPSPTEPNTDWVKSERPFPSPTSTINSGTSSPRAQYNESPCSAPGSEGLTDYKQQQSERQVIQRVLQRTQVKMEPSANGVVDLSGLGESGTGQGTRSGLQDIIRPTPPLPQSPSHDTVYHHLDSHTPPSHTPPSPTGNSHLNDVTSSALKSQDHSPNGMSSSSTPSSPDSSLPQRVTAPPPDPTISELEAIKENKCSVVGPARVEGPVSQSEEPLAGVGDVGEDPHVPDEDHAYALPTAPKTGGTPTPLLLPKLRDKGSLRSPANLPSAGDMEPALKRRCLRIRDQNK